MKLMLAALAFIGAATAARPLQGESCSSAYGKSCARPNICLREGLNGQKVRALIA
jgi:hypothetical protein